MHDYWVRQTDKPAFPNIEWEKPEQRAQAGKLLIIGGNKLGFAAVAQAYDDTKKAGIGEVRAVLPDALKRTIDGGLDCIFVPTNISGGITKDSLPAIEAGIGWADALLLVGDTGRNSETAITYEEFLVKSNKLAIITRDAVDLLKATFHQLVERDNTIFVISLAQLQKLFQAVYYPKTILFSMQLTTLVETLHKFTITYPITIVVFHQNQLVVAQTGRVSTTPWEDPMSIWRGSVAAKVAVYALQHKSRQFEGITSAVVTR